MKHARRRKKRIQKPAVRISAAHLKYPIACFAAAFILFAGFPYIFSSVFYVDAPVNAEDTVPDYTIDMPQTIKVYRTLTGKTETVDFEEYVMGVVAGEVPHTFKNEAMKAQAVAARTYSVARALAGTSSDHPSAPVCDTTHCQVYRDRDELEKLKGKDWIEKSYSKICSAVDATKGQIMYYNEKPVKHALFHSSSGGRTENCEDVFVSAVPYLVSVKSPYEDDATHKKETAVFSYRKLKSLIAASYPNVSMGSVNRNNVKIISNNEGGSVAKMQIGNAVLSGVEVRTALGLFSATFTVSPGEKNVVFTSAGSGHGVGLSQYGADGMAKEGYTYRQILKHYYTGVEIY